MPGRTQWSEPEVEPDTCEALGIARNKLGKIAGATKWQIENAGHEVLTKQVFCKSADPESAFGEGQPGCQIDHDVAILDIGIRHIFGHQSEAVVAAQERVGLNETRDAWRELMVVTTVEGQ